MRLYLIYYNKITTYWGNNMKNILKFVIAIGVSWGAGFVGSFFTRPAIYTWYEGLLKPTLNPPNWVFGPMWAALYTLMGVAAFLIWRRGFSEAGVKKALIVFVAHLALNALWSIVFFGFQSPGWALINIIVLWLAIIWTMKLFCKVSRLAAYLLAPYLIWVSYAMYLNYSIWILN
jgi:translocator protein